MTKKSSAGYIVGLVDPISIMKASNSVQYDAHNPTEEGDAFLSMLPDNSEDFTHLNGIDNEQQKLDASLVEDVLSSRLPMDGHDFNHNEPKVEENKIALLQSKESTTDDDAESLSQFDERVKNILKKANISVSTLDGNEESSEKFVTIDAVMTNGSSTNHVSFETPESKPEEPVAADVLHDKVNLLLKKTAYVEELVKKAVNSSHAVRQTDYEQLQQDLEAINASISANLQISPQSLSSSLSSIPKEHSPTRVLLKRSDELIDQLSQDIDNYSPPKQDNSSSLQQSKYLLLPGQVESDDVVLSKTLTPPKPVVISSQDEQIDDEKESPFSPDILNEEEPKQTVTWKEYYRRFYATPPSTTGADQPVPEQVVDSAHEKTLSPNDRSNIGFPNDRSELLNGGDNAKEPAKPLADHHSISQNGQLSQQSSRDSSDSPHLLNEKVDELMHLLHNPIREIVSSYMKKGKTHQSHPSNGNAIISPPVVAEDASLNGSPPPASPVALSALSELDEKSVKRKPSKSTIKRQIHKLQKLLSEDSHTTPLPSCEKVDAAVSAHLDDEDVQVQPSRTYTKVNAKTRDIALNYPSPHISSDRPMKPTHHHHRHGHGTYRKSKRIKPKPEPLSFFIPFDPREKPWRQRVERDFNENASAGVRNPSLQELFEQSNTNFISRSQERLHYIRMCTAERHMSEPYELQRELLQRERRIRARERVVVSAPTTKPAPLSMKQMKEYSRAKYSQLPEVRRKVDEAKKEQRLRENRLKAQLYKERVLRQVLAKARRKVCRRTGVFY